MAVQSKCRNFAQKKLIMGKYIHRGNDVFTGYANSDYVDKTGLIGYINSTIETASRLTCVTRPRRFGKSMAAQMLYAYYDKSSDSRKLFCNYQIAQHPSFERHLNKYPTIFIDITEFTTRYEGNDAIVERIQSLLIKDLTKTYPDVEIDEDDDLMDVLLNITVRTGEKFVIIIDEWDALCREAADKPQLMNKYVNLLRRMFKSSDTARVFACVYMTGILPIKRYGTQSALNDFREFSMANPGQLAGYIGFTDKEVSRLCDKYGMNYKDMEAWYDGYYFGSEYPAIFNPNSVMAACSSKIYDNYWGKTSLFETLQQYIDLNLTNVSEKLDKILREEKVIVSTLRFGFDVNAIGSDDELFTLFIHLGYLSYNIDDKTIRIPNKEIRMEFIEAVRGSNSHKELSRMIKESDRLLEATWAKDEEAVAKALEKTHSQQTAPDFYNNEQALRAVVNLAYISAIDHYISIQELPSGKGYADIVFIPRTNSSNLAMIVELKWNKSKETAIDQIRRQDYPQAISTYTGKILLVGVNYDEKTKHHSCKIEEWNPDEHRN